jgi:hypothetical protein
VVGKLGSDPKGKIAKAILASLRATMLRRGSCQTFFYLTRICSGGKVRERPEGENCESNFSESPSNCVVKG